MTILQSAIELAQAGFAVHYQQGKAAIEKGWNVAPFKTPDELTKEYRDGLNIAIRTGHYSLGGLVVVDVDIRSDDPIVKRDAWAAFKRLTGGVYITTKTGGGGIHSYFRCPADKLPKVNSLKLEHGLETSEGKYSWAIEILANGHALTVPPSIHDKTGKPYEWANGGIAHIPDIPQCLLNAITDASRPKTLEGAVLDFQALLRADLPERPLILPWLPQGGLAMVYASPGVGKTQFSLSLAASITAGEPFMKWQTVEPCGVMFVDGEMPLGGDNGSRARLTNFVKAAPKFPLLTLSHEIYYQKCDKDIDISDDGIQTEILALLEKNTEVRLVIFDNLSTLLKIREDKADDWNAVFQPFLIKLRRRGIAVLLVHHANKGGENQSGTGARERPLDTSIRLSKPEDAQNNEGAYFRVDFVKSRGCYGKDVEPFTARLEEKGGFGTWEIAAIGESNKQRLLNLITESGSEGTKAKEAAEELDLKPSHISKLRKQLEEEKLIEKAVNRSSPMRCAQKEGH